MYGECMWCLWSANGPAESINSGSSCRELMSTTTAVTIDSRAKQETVMGFIYCRKFIPMWVVAITALLAVGPTSAEECRKVKTVKDSMSSLAENGRSGGRVWVHVYMATPGTEGLRPEMGGPVFNSPADFGTLWKAWLEVDKKSGADCGNENTRAEDCVQIKDLEKVPTKFSTCAGVSKDNVCDRKVGDIKMEAVKFEYRFKSSKGSGKKGKRTGKWILYDAAPSSRTDCFYDKK